MMGRQDHPRSRGVYLGLRVVAAALGRIIPARAGFTPPPIRHSLLTWDHPRSRGVYDEQVPVPLQQLGSSPLARGLPHVSITSIHIARIIPARAGFTLADPWNPNEPTLYQTPAAFTADPGSAPPSCGSAVVVPRWTTTPSGA